MGYEIKLYVYSYTVFDYVSRTFGISVSAEVGLHMQYYFQ